MSTSSINLSSFRAISNVADNLDRQILVGKKGTLVLGGKSVSAPKEGSKAEQSNMLVRAALANAISKEKGLPATVVCALMAKLGLGNNLKPDEAGMLSKPLMGRDIKEILTEVDNAHEREAALSQVRHENERFRQQADFMHESADGVRSKLDEFKASYPKCPPEVVRKFQSAAEDSIRSVVALIDSNQRAGKAVDLEKYKEKLGAVLDVIMGEAETKIAAADKEQRVAEARTQLNQKCDAAKTTAREKLAKLGSDYPKCSKEVLESLKASVEQKIDEQAGKMRQSLDSKQLDTFEADLNQLDADVTTALSEAETKAAAADKEQRVAEARTHLDQNCNHVSKQAQETIAKLRNAYSKCPADVFKSIEESVGKTIEDNAAKAKKTLNDGKLEDFAKNLEDLIGGVNKVLGEAQTKILAKLSEIRHAEERKVLNEDARTFCDDVMKIGGEKNHVDIKFTLIKGDKTLREQVSRAFSKVDDAGSRMIVAALNEHRLGVRTNFNALKGNFVYSVDSSAQVESTIGLALKAYKAKAPTELVKIEPLTVLPLEGEVDPPKEEQVKKDPEPVKNEPVKTEIEQPKEEPPKMEPPKEEPPKVEPPKEEPPKVAAPQKPVVAEVPKVDVQKELADARKLVRNSEMMNGAQLDGALTGIPVGDLGRGKWDTAILPSLKAEYAAKYARLVEDFLAKTEVALKSGDMNQVQQLRPVFIQMNFDLVREITVKARFCAVMNDSMVMEVPEETKKGRPPQTVIKHVQHGWPTKDAKDDIVTSQSFAVDIQNKTVTLPPDTFKLIFKTMSFQLMGQDLHRMPVFQAVPNNKVANGVDVKVKYVPSSVFTSAYEPTLHTTMSVSDGKMKIRITGLSGQNFASTAIYQGLQKKAFSQIFTGEDKDGHFGNWLEYVPLKEDGLVNMTVNLDRMVSQFGLDVCGFGEATGLTVGNDGTLSLKFA